MMDTRYTWAALVLSILLAPAFVSGQGGGETLSSLLLKVLTPLSNVSVTQYQFFNVTLNVTCIIADCGTVNVTLDPTGAGVASLLFDGRYYNLSNEHRDYYVDEATGDVSNVYGELWEKHRLCLNASEDGASYREVCADGVWSWTSESAGDRATLVGRQSAEDFDYLLEYTLNSGEDIISVKPTAVARKDFRDVRLVWRVSDIRAAGTAGDDLLVLPLRVYTPLDAIHSTFVHDEIVSYELGNLSLSLGAANFSDSWFEIRDTVTDKLARTRWNVDSGRPFSFRAQDSDLSVIFDVGELQSGAKASAVLGWVDLEVSDIQANVTFNGTKNSGQLGWSVSSGDFNGDGVDDALIGANQDGPGTNRGNAYVFFGKSGWRGNFTNLQANVTLNGTKDSGFFGGSVSSGDFNGDGVDDALVGANQDGPGTNRGNAYVFFGKSGWGGNFTTLQANVTLNGTKDSGYFGISVSSGDFNGDIIDDALVGAYQDGLGTSRGSAYVFFGKSGWGGNFTNLQANVTLNGTKDSGYFGESVSSGDFNGDNIDDALVGAYQDGLGTSRGNAYVFFGKSGWRGNFTNLQANVTLNGTKDSGYFGWSVSSGDFNGDNVDDVLVGAYPDGLGTSRGSAYVFFGKSGWGGNFTNLQANVTLNGTKDNGYFGISVSSGDFSGDGVDEMLVGAYGGNGSAFIYNLFQDASYKGVIPVGSGMPFYTNASSNPVRTSSLVAEQSQILTFWVNVTGPVDTGWDFFAQAALESNRSVVNTTNVWYVTIKGSNTGPLFGWRLLQPAESESNDTFIDNSTTVNYFNERTLKIGRLSGAAYRGLLRFELSLIPANATVNNTRMSLYLYNSTYYQQDRPYNSTASWVETQANWTYRTSTLLWGTPGGDYI